MWQLVELKTGKVEFHYLWDQWEASKYFSHVDGRRYEKRETLALKSGAIVYRCANKKKFIKMPVIQNGRVVYELTRTTTIREMIPYRLEKIS